MGKSTHAAFRGEYDEEIGIEDDVQFVKLPDEWYKEILSQSLPNPYTTLIEACRSAEDALARCYDVVDWPCGPDTPQALALAKVRDALANVPKGTP